MEIIFKGQVPGEQVWVGTCRNCKSRAKASQRELTNIVNDQRDGSHCWMTCPVCGVGPYNGMLFYPE